MKGTMLLVLMLAGCMASEPYTEPAIECAPGCYVDGIDRICIDEAGLLLADSHVWTPAGGEWPSLGWTLGTETAALRWTSCDRVEGTIGDEAVAFERREE